MDLLCRLCVTSSQDHIRIYDENGHENETHTLITKYFHPLLLNVELCKQLTVICLDCWNHILDFHNFQQLVYQTQKALEQVGAQDVEEVDVKCHEEFIPEDSGSKKTSFLAPGQEPREIIPDVEFCQYDGSDEKVTILNVDTTSVVISDNENSLIASDSDNAGDITNCSGIVPELEPINLISDDDISQYDDNDEVSGEEYDDPVGIFIGGEFKEDIVSVNLTESDNVIFPPSSDDEPNCQPEKNCQYTIESGQIIVDTTNLEANLNVSVFKKETKINNNTIVTGGAKRRKELQEVDDFIAQWRPYLQCEICNHRCTTFNLLRQHFRKDHPHDECYITCCERKLKHRHMIEDHIRYHLDPKAFTCDICGVDLTSRSAVRQHKVNVHKDIKASNTSAVINLNTPADFDSLVSRWKPSLECAVCLKSYSSFSILKNHFKERHSQWEFYISCCQVKLKNRQSIKEHIELHSDHQVHICSICNKNFIRRYNLEIHMRSHSSGQGMSMDEFVAQWQSQLDCNKCKEPFTKFSLFSSHFRRKHPRDNIYILCCQRKVKGRKSILEHVRYHLYPDEFTCALCGKRYNTKSTLCRHRRAKHKRTKKAFQS